MALSAFATASLSSQRPAPAATHGARYSLAGTIDRGLPYLSPALVSTACRARLHATSRQLPAAWTSRVYFECRLAAGDDRVDLVVAVRRPEAQLLAGDHAATALPPSLRTDPIWNRLRTFCAAWVAGRSPLYQAVDHLWFEFDIDRETQHRAPVPGVFVSFGEVRPAGYSAPLWYARTTEALDTLLPDAHVPGRTSALARCFEHLPPNGYVHSIGLMFPRPTDRVRLCLTGIADADLPDYLGTIGWPGSPARLARLLARLASRRSGTSHAGVGLLHLDVGGGVAGRLGLEYYFDRQPQLGGHVAETTFLHDLKQMKLCAADKIHGLQQWPGYGLEALPHEVWPSLVVRRVNHVKIVYEPGRKMAAKAYLYLAHRFHSATAGSPERRES